MLKEVMAFDVGSEVVQRCRNQWNPDFQKGGTRNAPDSRLIVKSEPTVYHVMSRTALDGFVLGDIEKEYLVSLIKRLSKAHFSEVLGFCVMGNHFHLLVRMHPGEKFDDEKIKGRFLEYYGDDKEMVLGEGQIPLLREKWSSLSEYMKEIKQGFSRFYNRRHRRKGFF